MSQARKTNSKHVPAHTKRLKAFWDYVLELDGFSDHIEQVRERYKIPKNGYKANSDDLFAVSPPIPKKWNGDESLLCNLVNEMQGLAMIHYLGPLANWKDALLWLVFYGLVPISDEMGLCAIEDIGFSRRNRGEKNAHQRAQFTDRSHPVAIRISPYASERDIIDFVKYHYKRHVEPIQRQHRTKQSKIMQVRSKSDTRKAIVDYIYENRSKTANKLLSDISEKWGRIYSMERIDKIRHRERKRRQDK